MASVESHSVAVVVLNWNGAQDTIACVHSLHGHPVSELVVLDNGSEDDSVQQIRTAFPELRLIENGANLGFAEGVNRGIAATTSEWVFVLNNDAELTEGCLEKLLSVARSAAPSIGMIQPLVLFRDRPGHINSSGVVLLRGGSAVDRDFDRPVDAVAEGGGGAEPFAITAGAGLYRRKMLEAVELRYGVFDRTHFMYFEDVDLGWRARLAGWEARLVPDARVLHGYQKSSAKQASRFVERLCKLNRMRMVLKNGSGPLLSRYLLGRRFWNDLVWLTKHQGPGGFAAGVKALVDGVRSRPEVSAQATVSRVELESAWMDRA